MKSETMRKIAQEAIDVQDGCNPCGIARAFVEAMELMIDEGCGTNEISLHPVTTMFVSKLASLNGGECLCDACLTKYGEAYRACRKLAADGKERAA